MGRLSTCTAPMATRSTPRMGTLSTIGRWERGEFPIDGCAETVIRRLTVEKLLIPFEETMESQAHDEQKLESSEQSARSILLERLMRSRVATAEPKAIEIKIERGGYKLLAA